MNLLVREHAYIFPVCGQISCAIFCILKTPTTDKEENLLNVPSTWAEKLIDVLNLAIFFFIFWIYLWISFTSLITSFGILNLGGISISCCNSSYIISSFYGSSWYYFPEFQRQLQVIFCACVSRPCQVSSMILFNTVLVGSWGLTMIVLDKIFPSQIFGHFMVNFLF